MSGTRMAVGRVVALGLLLALSVLLLAAARASAGKFAVAQCGWYVGADASWADTTGGAKFRPDAWCVPPAGADPFDGAHVKSFTRDGQGTVTGTRFARWRWTAPPGAWFTQVRGSWWHALHDGMEQRVGAVDFAGGFSPFLAAAATDTTPREFVAGFRSPVAAVEDRLLCARAEDRWCSLANGSWSALRALTFTLEDPSVPAPRVGGDLLAGGWKRGTQSITISGEDGGSGIRFGETFVDGARVALTEFPCAEALIGGEWRGTQMQPCAFSISGAQAIATATLSDGPHLLVHCEVDFARNLGCAPQRSFLVDNNPPAHPRSPTLAEGDGWRRSNDFDLGWSNPDQAPASPIAGASWRITGPGGFDSGVKSAPGRDRKALSDLTVPAAGAYSLQVWLRDEAGNEAPLSAVTVPLRYDNQRPTVAFAAEEPVGQLVAEVGDPLSGPASGQLLYRRAEDSAWRELPTKLVPGSTAGSGRLVAPMPALGYGTYLFRADASDAAGNSVTTTLRSDGTQMALRREPPPHLRRRKTKLFARLRGGAGSGEATTIPYAAAALLSGRLVSADGEPLAEQELRIVSHLSKGALLPIAAETAKTDEQGHFSLRLAPGPSRRVTVAFAGGPGLDPARRPALELRVCSKVLLRARPLSLRTGDVVRLSGRVAGRGAPLPRRGKLVAIQYLESSTGRWRPVLVTRTDHEGRFRARYRFRYIDGRATVRLRATALAEEHWPYAPGSSAPVTVEVTG
jgi:hypothetical protein